VVREEDERLRQAIRVGNADISSTTTMRNPMDNDADPLAAPAAPALPVSSSTDRWTGLLAGAAAHDVNTFVHSVANGRALLGKPGVGNSDAAETEQLLEGCLVELRKLGVRLRALAIASESTASANVGEVCANARAEVVPVRGQMLQLEPIPADLCVRGTAAAVTTAIASLLEHAVAASPAGATIRLAARSAHAVLASRADAAREARRGSVIVEVTAPQAGELGTIGKARLDVLLATTLRELRGDVSLVLPGAIADALAGAVYLASDRQGGLVLVLELIAAVPASVRG
jgi:hypothetical protein